MRPTIWTVPNLKPAAVLFRPPRFDNASVPTRHSSTMTKELKLPERPLSLASRSQPTSVLKKCLPSLLSVRKHLNVVRTLPFEKSVSDAKATKVTKNQRPQSSVRIAAMKCLSGQQVSLSGTPLHCGSITPRNGRQRKQRTRTSPRSIMRNRQIKKQDVPRRLPQDVPGLQHQARLVLATTLRAVVFTVWSSIYASKVLNPPDTYQRTPPLTSPRDDDPRHASADDEDSERGSAVGTPRRAKRIRTPGSKRGSPSPRKKTSLRRRRSKPKQADYTGDAQLALIRACRGFKVRTGTEGVFFNDTNTPKAIAMESWREANVHYGLNYKIDANIIKIISDRASQLRGAAKTSGDSKFADLYGFRDGTLDEDIAFNKALVIKLQTKDGYTWITAPTPDTPGSGNGLYKHKLIGRIIIDVFFSGHRDKRLAEIFPTPFNPIPLPTIALACTAIAACVDEWATAAHEASQRL
ncbi:hypothetical protein SISSUDRAFT_421227 [Sistotremastrum suecicum HHB10207 ss-3]|uniref:DUF6532 domain-containing protein n=1 Tax=Sistotremastrum suecicum HHB10207 ss-3 TaxID=1314776 RepID=A0A165YKI8_9AGAM|nr:hypothetical protein SISSUDRAFT_421227 [Sistotremastrum suecicum HHB10207 ss-3]